MRSISEIECRHNGCIIRTSSQLKIEQVIMNENSKRFTLAYSSPLFRSDILNQIGTCAENQAASDLTSNNTPLTGLDADLRQFLSLLFNKDITLISNHVSR